MWNISSDYKHLKSEFNVKEWMKWEFCPDCEFKPRVWIFNNGRFAKCACFGLYQPGVSATPIMKYIHSKGNTLGYNQDELRINWNKHIQNLIRRNKIKNICHSHTKK